MRNPDRAPDAHAPPGGTRSGQLLLATTAAVLAPGPILTLGAIVTGDPGLAALAGRMCRTALELSAVLGALAALRPGR
jgi:hypothetical protein